VVALIVSKVDLKQSSEEKRHSSEKKEDLTKHPPEKKQRVSGGFSNSEKELYERLVEAERQRALSEKARGDDLRDIAMALASGKKDDVVIPPSPAGDAAEEAAAEDAPDSPKPKSTASETPAKQRHDKLRTLAGVAAGVGGSAAKSQSKQKGSGII